MSMTWRYLVRPNGSFWRTPNINGSLDNVSDAELDEIIRLIPTCRDQDKQPTPCSRCGGGLLLHWHSPLNGPFSRGIYLELCPACDASRPAAHAYIQWYRDLPRDPKKLPELFEAWEDETMHAHGWARILPPEAPTSPPAHPRLIPRGHG